MNHNQSTVVQRGHEPQRLKRRLELRFDADNAAFEDTRGASASGTAAIVRCIENKLGLLSSTAAETGCYRKKQADQLLSLVTELAQRVEHTPGPRARPKLLVNRRGEFVETNGAWKTLYCQQRAHENVDQLPFDCASIASLRAALRTPVKIFEPFTCAIIATHLIRESKVLLTVSRVGRLIQITSSDFVWHGRLDRLLEDSFDLTAAEIAVVRLLVDGQSIKGVARQRATSVVTVRTQVRAIYAKTGVSSMSELVRMVTAAAEA